MRNMQRGMCETVSIKVCKSTPLWTLIIVNCQRTAALVLLPSSDAHIENSVIRATAPPSVSSSAHHDQLGRRAESGSRLR